MATAQIIAVGKMSKGSTEIRVAPGLAWDVAGSDLRLAELQEWQRETGRELPFPADLILWLEDRGFTVDLLTGCTERLEPLQRFIDEAAELQELEDDIADRAFWASGAW